MQKPGVVIFTTVLNYVAAVFYGLGAIFSLIVVLLGARASAYQYVTKQIANYYPQLHLAGSLQVIFGIILAVCLFSIWFHIWLGLGLLAGKKSCWYMQVVLSVIGLLAFPIGTVLNGIILFLFFRPNIREYFKV